MVSESLENRLEAIIRESRDGYLPSGVSLCRELGVSYPTLQKALKRLQVQGLVEMRQGRRTRILSGAKTFNRSGPASAEQLSNLLAERIKKGEMRIGSRLPKHAYLMDRTRIASATVTTAFRMLEHSGLAHKSGRSWLVGPRSVRELDSGRNLGDASSAPVVLLMVPDYFEWRNLEDSERTARFVQTFFEELRIHGHITQVILPAPLGPPAIFPAGREGIRDFIQLLNTRFAGVLVSGRLAQWPDLGEWVQWFAEFGKPVVWFDREDAGGGLFASLGGRKRRLFRCHFNESAAINLALDSLVAAGHRRCAFVLPSQADEKKAAVHWMERRWGLIERMVSGRNLPLHMVRLDAVRPLHKASAARRVSASARKDSAPMSPSLYRILRMVRRASSVPRSLSQHPLTTALLAPNDSFAENLYFSLIAKGVSVPGDIALLSFDNYAHARCLPISTIDFGFDNLGYSTAQLFLGVVPIRSDPHGNISARCVLVDRGSLVRHQPATAPERIPKRRNGRRLAG